MFGTLKPVHSKLNQDEKNLYKMYYCGLCSSLGRVGGWVLRMGLSYDIAFMYMLLDCENAKKIEKCFCPGNILRKKNCIDNKVLADYMAAVSIVLLYGKCIDNINDNEKIIQSKLLLTLLKKELTKLKDINGDILEITRNGLDRVALCEKNFEGLSFVDIADQFGKLTGKLFEMAPGLDEPEVYNKLGYWLGRWIYIADAATDIRQDLKKKRFNPFIVEKQMSLKEVIGKYEKEITAELFKAHDCVVDLLKLIDNYKETEKTVNIISFAMEATEGNIFRLQEEIKNV